MADQKGGGKYAERRPFVAGLLNFIMLGLGYLYNGQLKRSVAFLAFGVFIYGMAFAATELLPLYLGAVFYGVWALTYLVIATYIAIDAYRYARHSGLVELQRFNRWYVYVSVFLLVNISTIPLEPSIEAFSMPSGSMTPNLLVGDRFFVHTSAYRDQPLERGDVAVFKLPTDGTDYVKRIVGLPGDTMQVKQGILHINGEAVRRKRIGNLTYIDTRGSYHDVTQYEETMPNGPSHLIFEESDSYPADNTPVYKVPEGHFFALGDNRDNSRDSRFQQDVGYIPFENMTGKVVMIYFSTNGSASWFQFWRWHQAIRFDRIGLNMG